MRRASVVLLHGVQSSSRYWWRAKRDLQDLGIEVRSFDLLGHAGRSATDPLTLEVFADDVAEQFVGQRADLVVGHSLGALVALVVGRDHPELIGSVMLEDPPALGADLDPNDVADAIDREAGQVENSAEQFVADTLAVHDEWSRRDVMDDVSDLRELDVAGVTGWLRTERWDLVDLVARCAVPVHLMAATEGALTQPTLDLLFEQLRDADVTRIASGHQIQRERPASWLFTVLTQLGEATPQPTSSRR